VPPCRQQKMANQGSCEAAPRPQHIARLVEKGISGRVFQISAKGNRQDTRVGQGVRPRRGFPVITECLQRCKEKYVKLTVLNIKHVLQQDADIGPTARVEARAIEALVFRL
jgi:hypothetical protein